jgi:hypothetical protein
MDLGLWMVRMTMASEAQLTLLQVEVADPDEINGLENLTGRNAQGSVPIKKMQSKISHYWPVPPAPDYLQIIIERPSGERCTHWVSEISLTVLSIVFNLLLTSPLHLAALLIMSLFFIATYHAFLVSSLTSAQMSECFISLFALNL